MSGDDSASHQVVSKLAVVLDQRGMTLVELAVRTGVTVANLSVLKNGRARAVRFSTLTAICHALNCQPGDLLEVHPGTSDPSDVRGDRPATSSVVQPVEGHYQPVQMRPDRGRQV